MAYSLPHKPTRSRSKATWVLASAGLVIVLAFLALVSIATTHSEWDGGFPAGEYDLKIQDESGAPVEGALLSVCAEGTEIPAFGYPIDNYVAEGSLVSDTAGIIAALHNHHGLEFGGTSRRLFWLFEIGDTAPAFDLRISADGYRTLEFSSRDLFELGYSGRSIGTTSVTLQGGEQTEIPIYELTLVMDR